MADDGRLSSVIDEDGRLFGVVNIIDAFVVLVVVAVAVVGVVFVLGLGGETDTRYVTIDLGPQPDYTAQQIAAGDEWDAGQGFTITDVYMAPAGDEEGGDAHVIVRAAVNGSLVDPAVGPDGPITFDGEPLRFGRILDVQTAKYAVEGTVIAVDTEGETIDTSTEELVLEADVDADTASTIRPGDEYRIGDTSLLTVESVAAYPTGEEGERRVVLGIAAETRLEGDTPLFGQRPVQIGNTLPVETGSYALDGRIVNTGSLEEPGSPATVTATLDLGEMTQDRVDRLSVGMTESFGEEETAELVGIDSQPVEEIVQSGDGYQVLEHPSDREVTVTVDLSVRELDDGTLRFRGQTFEPDEELRLNLEGTSIEGDIVSIEGDSP